MRVEYDTTLADHIELYGRMMKRQGTVPRYRRYVMLTVIGLLVVLLLIRNSPIVGLIGVGACVSVMGLIIAPAFDRWHLRSRLIKIARQQMGGNSTQRFVVNIQNDALVMTTGEAIETRVPWSAVAEAVETLQYVEISMRPQGMVLIADRAFATARERAAFIAALRSRMTPA